MYNVDINFLKNRPEYQNLSAPVDRSGATKQFSTNYSKAPIFAGLGLGVAALFATGTAWLITGWQGESLQAKQVELDKQLGAAKEQETKLTTLQTQIAQTEQESKSLAGAFNLVRPWSAIMREFRDNTPQGVQISSIIQAPIAAVVVVPKTPGVPGAAATKLAATPATVDSNGVPSKGAPSPSPSTAPVAASPAATVIDTPVVKIDVEGVAQSFNDVNSFILTLKQSPFFNPEATQLVSSDLVENKVAVSASAVGTTTATTITTKSVKYKIQTSLKQIPATELLRELERKGAVGLVTRLKTLQQQKVIKP